MTENTRVKIGCLPTVDRQRTRTSRRLQVFCAFAVATAQFFIAPKTSWAHGVSGRADLPLPGWLFAWGAAAVLIFSFLALGALWTQPKLARQKERRLLQIPLMLRIFTGLIGITLFGLIVYAGFVGSQTPSANITPQFIYVIFWSGLAPISFLFGNVFLLFSPWRATGKAIRWLSSKNRPKITAKPLPYPKWLGNWPAVVGLFGFAWLELVYPDKADPSTLAILALGYTAVQCVGMILYGVDTWLERGESFQVFFSLLSRIAPVSIEDTEIKLRLPLTGATRALKQPGSVPLLLVAIGSTAFDGFSQSSLWSNLAPKLSDTFSSVGFSQRFALELAFTTGLITLVTVTTLFYYSGIFGARTIDNTQVKKLARSFGHSLIPIAAAYFIAHYFSLLAYQGQAIVYLISDPLGKGANLFGTAAHTINYSWISATQIWYVQVAALILGHVAALILAHDRALETYTSTRNAVRSQYWLLATMVGFTMLGLWLLSAANG